MNVVVITGTEVKGITYHIKETFLAPLRDKHEITEFYLPKDMPHFCTGCKVCVLKDEALCPHAGSVVSIWNAMLDADLIVFAYPVYVLRAPGQVKSLLDHLCSHWMVHRPDPKIFSKRAVILTQSIGAPNGSAQKEVATSLSWMGISSIKKLGFGLMEGIIWDELSSKRRGKIERKVQRLGKKHRKIRPAKKNLTVKMKFFICKIMHKAILKKEETPSPDNQYWIDKNWIKK